MFGGLGAALCSAVGKSGVVVGHIAGVIVAVSIGSGGSGGGGSAEENEMNKHVIECSFILCYGARAGGAPPAAGIGFE